jgi:phenylalanyl-tRNA synthetase beta chain
MRVSYRWLQEYVKVDLSAEVLADKLTMAGLAVEGIADPVPGLDGIVVGRIVEIRRHPNSDHIQICRVDTGAEVVQVLSGAPNLAPGANVPYARLGTVLPYGGRDAVGVRQILGERSEGVLCSGAELCTEEWGFGDALGVLILGSQAQPGDSLVEALGLHDRILEFELTPNRGDCLAVLNIAREVRALTGGGLTLPETSVRETGERTESLISVQIEEPELCRRYACRVVRNVKLAASPEWLCYRLRAAGIRPINNIVDVTNYVMLELGQPLHAFNYDRLQGRRIIVRRARQGEEMVSLDGDRHKLDQEMLVIADAVEPVALAGVMGGLASEVAEETRTVLLESAYFNPQSIRRTAQKLGMRTESGQRFEKGIDLEGAVRALNRAAHLITELDAGEITCGVVDQYVRPAAPLVIRVRTPRVNQVLGAHLNRAEVQEILCRLDFVCELCGQDSLLVNVPPYRQDLLEEIDLIEEVARLYGYDQIVSTIPVGALAQSGQRPALSRIRELTGRAMMAAGLDEVITYSFIGESDLDRLNIPGDSPLRRVTPIQNPLREEQGILRPLLLASLIDALNTNYKRKQTRVGLFELGTVFNPALCSPLAEEVVPDPTGVCLQDRVRAAGDSGALPEERLHLGFVACGEVDRGWQEPAGARDFFYAKGIAEQALEMLGISGTSWEPVTDDPMLHPGRAARVLVAGEPIGVVGEVHPEVLRNYELPTRVVACEIDLTSLLPMAQLDARAQALPRYPGSARDLAIIVPLETPAGHVREVIMAAGGDLLRECRLFDVYQGAQVPAGCRSLGYSLLFQSLERTLTDEEVTVAYDRILEALSTGVGARLR